MLGTVLDENGFTFIEIIGSIFILVVGVVGLAVLTSVSVQGNDQPDKTATATYLAQQKLEQLKRLDHNDPALLYGMHTEATSEIEFVDDDFRRKWEILPSRAAKGAKTIRVTVTWDAGEHSVIMSTIAIGG